MTDDDLSGTFVLVHPRLSNDPENRKNQVGVIVSADLQNDNIIVGFSDETESIFSADALLVLRNVSEIERDADYDFNLLPREDYWDIREVCFLAGSWQTECRRAAIELAQQSEMTQEYALRPLNDELGLSQRKGVSR